jgi:hypothetical protein
VTTIPLSDRDTATGAVSLANDFEYFVPVDPMDDLQCESCQ